MDGRTHFKFENIQHYDSPVRFYAGFVSFFVFAAFFEFLGPVVSKLHYWCTREGKRQCHHTRNWKLKVFITTRIYTVPPSRPMALNKDQYIYSIDSRTKLEPRNRLRVRCHVEFVVIAFHIRRPCNCTVYNACTSWSSGITYNGHVLIRRLYWQWHDSTLSHIQVNEAHAWTYM